MEDQSVSFCDAKRTLEDFESNLNSIADSMDDRDGSMAALKLQLKGCSRNLPSIVSRVNAIATAITEITEAYRNAEKKCYQDFGGSDNFKDNRSKHSGKMPGGLVGSTLLGMCDFKLRKNEKTTVIRYVQKTSQSAVSNKSISQKNKGTGKAVNPTQASQNGDKEYDRLKKEFEEIDKENTGINWSGCTDELIAAKDKFEALIKQKGWTIHFSSAYRSYEWQEHLYDVVEKIKENKFANEKIKQLYLDEKKKLGLGTVVAKPSKNAPHVKGIAFDATIYDKKGNKLNTKYEINNVLLELANKAGLINNIQDDRVHFQV